MFFIKRTTVLVVLILLSACAVQPQQDILFSSSAILPEHNVGIVMGALPKPQTVYPGADCLLCLAAAAAANDKLAGHSKTFSTADLASISNLVKTALDERGVKTKIIPQNINFKTFPKLRSKTPNTAKFDFSAYQAQHNIDHLVVIDLDFVGIQRSYSAYIPQGAPQAVIKGKAYMVNLSDHSYHIYRNIDVWVAAAGEWKQKPDFPNLTNAYYQAVENVRDRSVEAFAVISLTEKTAAAATN